MNKFILIPAFLLMVIAQWLLPANMIFKKEKIIQSGKEFLFRSAPVDPNDPLMGKYIDLSFDITEYEVPQQDTNWFGGDDVYVMLDKDSVGLARIASISHEVPAQTEDYIKALVSYIYEDSIKKVIIAYPFNRFYMEESIATHAEGAYRESARDTAQTTVAVISVRKGEAVIKNVLINGVPIKEVARLRRDLQE